MVVIDVATGEKRREIFKEPNLMTKGGIHGNDLEVNGICCTPDGKRLVAAFHGGTVRVWDIESEKAAANSRHRTGYPSVGLPTRRESARRGGEQRRNQLLGSGHSRGQHFDPPIQGRRKPLERNGNSPERRPPRDLAPRAINR